MKTHLYTVARRVDIITDIFPLFSLEICASCCEK